MTFNELRQEAARLGINSRGMKGPEIEAAIAAKDVHNGMRGARSEDREPEQPRRKRIPLGVPSLKLGFEQREGYYRYLFNDAKNRLHDAELAGYTYVNDTTEGRDQRVSRRVGVHEDGSPMFGFLMEIRQEFHDEDEAGKMAVVDEIDAAITRPDQPNDNDGDRSGFYTPNEGTSIRPAK